MHLGVLLRIPKVDADRPTVLFLKEIPEFRCGDFDYVVRTHARILPGFYRGSCPEKRDNSEDCDEQRSRYLGTSKHRQPRPTTLDVLIARPEGAQQDGRYRGLPSYVLLASFCCRLNVDHLDLQYWFISPPGDRESTDLGYADGSPRGRIYSLVIPAQMGNLPEYLEEMYDSRPALAGLRKRIQSLEVDKNSIILRHQLLLSCSTLTQWLGSLSSDLRRTRSQYPDHRQGLAPPEKPKARDAHPRKGSEFPS